jgi:hypothetical protein
VRLAVHQKNKNKIGCLNKEKNEMKFVSCMMRNSITAHVLLVANYKNHGKNPPSEYRSNNWRFCRKNKKDGHNEVDWEQIMSCLAALAGASIDYIRWVAMPSGLMPSRAQRSSAWFGLSPGQAGCWPFQRQWRPPRFSSGASPKSVVFLLIFHPIMYSAAGGTLARLNSFIAKKHS